MDSHQETSAATTNDAAAAPQAANNNTNATTPSKPRNVSTGMRNLVGLRQKTSKMTADLQAATTYEKKVTKELTELEAKEKMLRTEITEKTELLSTATTALGIIQDEINNAKRDIQLNVTRAKDTARETLIDAAQIKTNAIEKATTDETNAVKTAEEKNALAIQEAEKQAEQHAIAETDIEVKNITDKKNLEIAAAEKERAAAELKQASQPATTATTTQAGSAAASTTDSTPTPKKRLFKAASIVLGFTQSSAEIAKGGNVNKVQSKAEADIAEAKEQARKKIEAAKTFAKNAAIKKAAKDLEKTQKDAASEKNKAIARAETEENTTKAAMAKLVEDATNKAKTDLETLENNSAVAKQTATVNQAKIQLDLKDLALELQKTLVEKGRLTDDVSNARNRKTSAEEKLKQREEEKKSQPPLSVVATTPAAATPAAATPAAATPAAEAPPTVALTKPANTTTSPQSYDSEDEFDDAESIACSNDNIHEKDQVQTNPQHSAEQPQNHLSPAPGNVSSHFLLNAFAYIGKVIAKLARDHAFKALALFLISAGVAVALTYGVAACPLIAAWVAPLAATQLIAITAAIGTFGAGMLAAGIYGIMARSKYTLSMYPGKNEAKVVQPSNDASLVEAKTPVNAI